MTGDGVCLGGGGRGGGEEGGEGRDHHQGQEKGDHRGTDGQLDGGVLLQTVTADNRVGDQGVGGHDAT